MAIVYQHSYAKLSIYGNVISLLQTLLPLEGVHLDIGCGYGPIAEPISHELGLSYVGFDLADDGLLDLSRRGFETHTIDLSNVETAERTIIGAVADRPIASLTFLDTLEHIVNGPEVVAMLRRLAGSNAMLVLSVPNVTHKDIALKMLAGHWDVTEAGLLDHTHREGYSNMRLNRLMQATGWEEVGRKDWLLEQSDQKFPLDMPTMDHTLPVGHFLRQLIESANPELLVNQFVRLFKPGPMRDVSQFADRDEPLRPEFSVLVAVNNGGNSAPASIVTSLAAQSWQDFEIVVGRYAGTASPLHGDEATELPSSLLRKLKEVGSERASYQGALNGALVAASGRNIVILNESDLVSADWLLAFSELSRQRPGTVLRTGISSQLGTQPHLLPFGPEMLGPVASFCIPAGVVRHLGLRLDEKLDATSVYDLFARTIMLCGVHSAAAPTASIRDMVPSGSNQNVSFAGEGLIPEIAHGFNFHPYLLPAGGVGEIQTLVAKNKYLNETRAIENANALKLNTLTQFNATIKARKATGKNSIADEAGGFTPFLSVITRTRGTRNVTLRETLMSLAGQTSQNFEVVLVVHTENVEVVGDVKHLVAEFPPSFTARIKVIQTLRPGRAAPLNDALGHASGQYLAVLDDDDFVFAHWVETYEDLASQSPRAVLRSVCTRQDFVQYNLAGQKIPRATNWFQMQWPANYSFLRHLFSNYSPFMSMAFPVEVIQFLSIRWDETLSTTEDWHFATQMAMYCGVTCSPEVTSVYRWWTNEESSIFEHKENEWENNRLRIIDEFNSQTVLLPPGSVATIKTLLEIEQKSSAVEAYNQNILVRLQNLDENNSILLNKIDQITDHNNALLDYKNHTDQHNAYLLSENGRLNKYNADIINDRNYISNDRDLIFKKLSRFEAAIRGRCQKTVTSISSFDRKKLQNILELDIGRRKTMKLLSHFPDRLKDIFVASQSPFFDAGWYLETYSDARDFPLGALGHYLIFGEKEGRCPGPLFSPLFYIGQNPDIDGQNSFALVHFTLFGYLEGRPGTA